MANLGELDQKVLIQLQGDAAQSFDEIARKVNSSKTPVWNRIRKMREDGLFAHRPLYWMLRHLDSKPVFVLIRTCKYEAEWQAAFLKALNGRDEVQEAYRQAGDFDYI